MIHEKEQKDPSMPVPHLGGSVYAPGLGSQEGSHSRLLLRLVPHGTSSWELGAVGVVQHVTTDTELCE